MGGDIYIKVDLSNYATKADMKNTEVDNLHIDKFKNIPTNFSNLKNKID